VLLSTADPVFVVDLSPTMMARCAADFEPPKSVDQQSNAEGIDDNAGRELPWCEQEIRAIALVFNWQEDPVLLAIEPTRDGAMLDALARLLRTTLLTGESFSAIVTSYGDDEIKRMYFARRFPRFVYSGIPVPVRKRLPSELVEAMGRETRSRVKERSKQ
jgi:hypothetical protein